VAKGRGTRAAERVVRTSLYLWGEWEGGEPPPPTLARLSHLRGDALPGQADDGELL